ncbi:MAG: twin transmembrane helix small protein [Alphaproteobacteria bacterium]|nr:twin transmembrane helix small protein [Alphaproteobacteria bacterium]MBP7760062.1 twin transmembrane helix small protein [Alphaproteobacteria bacterium]MBP7763424.1 twin transmembrane helix small protein [Alphaproteobacteria bacterium]MBP7906174.1 twin transmembrane helix small protein [Alphaproteobacteria bacterium]
MHNAFVVLMLLAAAAVLGVLVVGIIGMLKGGDFNKKYGNKLMQARVMLQGLALVLLMLAYLSR